MIWMLAFVIIVTASAGVEDPTSKTWFIGIGMAVMIGGMGGHPHIIQFIANKDKLIRPTIRSARNTYSKRVYHFWIDSKNDPIRWAENNGLITDYTWVRNPKTGQKIIIPLPRGQSQMPVILKTAFPHPRWGKVFRVYIRWKGIWRERVPQMGCKASRWGAFGFDHNTGDDITLYEIPSDEFHPDVPVRETTNDNFPVFWLREGPGDITVWDRDERKEAMEILGMIRSR